MQYRVFGVHPTGLTVARGVGRCPQGSTPTSVAVPVDKTGTASVAPVMAPPVPGVQKPPRRVGKWFRDHLLVAPEEKVKKPASFKRDSLGCSRTAWVQTRRSAAATRAARRGVRGHASLEVADSNNLIPGPDSDGEGTGSKTAQNKNGEIQAMSKVFKN